MSDCRLDDVAVARTLAALEARNARGGGLAELRLSRSSLKPRGACPRLGSYVSGSVALATLCLSHCKLAHSCLVALTRHSLDTY